MIRILTLSQNVPGGAPREASLEELPRLLSTPSRVVWVDMTAPTPNEAAILLRDFRFHPVAVEDALEDVVHPKIDEYGDYLYVVLHGILDEHLPEDAQVAMHEIDFFLSRNFLVTLHEKLSVSIEHTWARVRRQPELYVSGPDFIFASVVERMVDRYMPIIEDFDERIEKLEAAIFAGHAGTDILERIFEHKRAALTLRRSVHPQREVIRNLAAGNHPLVTREAQIQLRDVQDHLVTIVELIESFRDLLAGALDAHVSMASNRLSIVMKRLTVITTILMVVSVLAGIYGMNFDRLPGSRHPAGFWAMLVLMVLSCWLTVWGLRRRQWI